MLTVWGRNNSINVQKVMWTVGELGLAHERIDAGRQYGGLDKPEFLAMNPNGLVPTIVDGDTVMWESNAIVRYLAAKYGCGGLWPEEPGARGLADQWMDWMVTVIIPPLIPVFLGLIRTQPEERDNDAIAAAANTMSERWTILDAHLAGRDFVAGDSLTIADIPVGCACYRYYAMDIPHPPLANLEAWYQRLQARAAFREHVMIELS
jgi:glutathione S-transferase